MKKGTLQPLLTHEMEPGQAIQEALKAPHPFACGQPLTPDLQDIVDSATADPTAFSASRDLIMQHWQTRALALQKTSLDELAAISDPHLRRLYMKGDTTTAATRQLGSFVHLALYREMTQAAGSPDMVYPDNLAEGFPIIGPVQRSGRWLARECEVKVPEETLLDRAWDLRKEVVESRKGRK